MAGRLGWPKFRWLSPISIGRCYRDNEGSEQVCHWTVRPVSGELGQVENLTHNRSPVMCVDRPRWIHYIPILLFPDKLEHVPIFTIRQSRYRSSINRWMASQDDTKPGSRIEHTDLSVARSADICNLKRTNPLEKFHYVPIHPFDRLSKNRSIERFLFSTARKRCTKRWLTKLHGSIVTSIDHTRPLFEFSSSIPLPKL